MRFRQSFLAAMVAGGVGLGSGATPAESAAPSEPAVTRGDHAVVALLSKGKPFCSGVLIAPRVVATAAHCIHRRPTGLSVFFGSEPLPLFGSRTGHEIHVIDSIVHPSYRFPAVEHDLALLLLEQAATVTPTGRSSARHRLRAGESVRVVGFGPASERDRRRVKRTSRAPLTKLGAATLSFAGHSGARSRLCVGESGGPLLIELGDRELVVGINSHGKKNRGGCVASEAHATRVSSYEADFIAPCIAEITIGSSAFRACAAAPSSSLPRMSESAPTAKPVGRPRPQPAASNGCQVAERTSFADFLLMCATLLLVVRSRP